MNEVEIIPQTNESRINESRINAIIGYTGFIGKNLFIQLGDQQCDLYNSKNIETISGKKYHRIYFSGLPATKYMINKNPEKDLDNIEHIKIILQTVQCDLFILISTIDVYNNTQNREDEDSVEIGNTSHYGNNRYNFERFVQKSFEHHIIVRLPGIFGLYLKKNVIYDLLYNENLQDIFMSDVFQWYPIRFLLSDINDCIKKAIN